MGHKTKKLKFATEQAVHFVFNDDKVTQDLSYERLMH